MPETFRHSIRVRYGECDVQGVVFNANWLAYIDIVITEVWRDRVGDYMEMLDSHGTDMVVAEANVRFLGPARFDDVIDFELRVSKLGTTSLSTAIDGTVDGQPVVAVAMRHVFIDPPTKRKKEMPEHIRAAFEPLVSEPVASES